MKSLSDAQRDSYERAMRKVYLGDSFASDLHARAFLDGAMYGVDDALSRLAKKHTPADSSEAMAASLDLIREMETNRCNY